MNSKRLLFICKLIFLVALAVGITYAIYKQWDEVQAKASTANFFPSPFGLLSYCGVMLTSAWVWLWLARKLGDRGPVLPLLGAYTYSQMGKYIPGKIALLFMRIERCRRYGMSVQTCTLSTLLENALYMISGALVGLLALLWHSRELYQDGKQIVLLIALLATFILLACCHPKIFYGLVNFAMRKVKKPEIPPAQQLSMGTLALSVLMFIPCWACGGLALWIATYCVSNQVPVNALPVFMGAFALSVILGMLSFIPSGLGPRDAVLGLFVTWEMHAIVGHKEAVAIAAVAVVLLRLYQILTEVLLGLIGSLISTGKHQAPLPAPTQG